MVALLTSCATDWNGEWGHSLRRALQFRWRGFDAEDFIDFIDDGQALGVGEGSFVVGAFAGLGVGGGEGLAVFGPFEFEFFAFNLQPGRPMAAALEGNEITDHLVEKIKSLLRGGPGGQLIAGRQEVLENGPVGQYTSSRYASGWRDCGSGGLLDGWISGLLD
jgi:hypothetical protein